MVAVKVGGTTEFQVAGRQALFGTAPFVFMPWHQGFGVRPGGRSFIMLRRTDQSAGPEAQPAGGGAQLVHRGAGPTRQSE